MSPVLSPRLRALIAAGVLGLTVTPALAAPGDLDLGFDPNPDNDTRSVAIQPDGKILIGGLFNKVGGVSWRKFARLLETGQRDASWYPDNDGVQVQAFAVMPDGSVISGGSYFEGVGHSGIGRVLPSAAVDQTFTTHVNGNLFVIKVQDDGKLLLAGDFNAVNGSPRRGVARLFPDGTLDTTYNPDAGASVTVHTAALEADGSALIGGTFLTAGGLPRNHIARVLPNGTVDPAFNPNATPANGDIYVNAIAVQVDGKILIGGNFNTVGGVAKTGFARLNRDGTLDTSFNTVLTSASTGILVQSIILQADGKILLSGLLERVNGQAHKSVVRLHPNGTLDETLNPEEVLAMGMALQADGKLVLVGTFPRVGSTPREGVARLFNDPATQQLEIANYKQLRWLRGGSSPESHRVTFELSTNDGASWSPLPAGQRITGGWEASGLNLPLQGQIRARARTSSGWGNGSSGLVEAIAPFSLAPEISVRDGINPGVPLSDGQATAVDLGKVKLGTPGLYAITVTNDGTAPLSISGVALPAGFSLATPPAFPASVDIGESLVLSLQATGSTPGTYSGTVTIASNDADEAAFDFPVTVRIVTPEISVRIGATELTDGQSQVIDFGRNIQGTPPSVVFTISNGGDAGLDITGITLPAGYTLFAPQLPLTVEPGATQDFRVELGTLAVGPHAGQLAILNDDLNEGYFDLPLSGEVYIPDPGHLVTSTQTLLQRQTGLREQTIQISNPTTATVPAYRVIISGLPAGVVVFNASEARPDGSYVIEVLQPLGPFSNSNLVLQYYSANRQPAEISPQVRSEVILDPPQAPAQAVVLRSLRQQDGSFLMQFTTTPGQEYAVEYSADGKTWKSSPLEIRAAGSRLQWIDRGPPVTDQSSASAATRFYRVKAATE